MEQIFVDKTIQINASATKVWDVLTKRGYTDIWANEFSPQVHIESNWQFGNPVLWRDKDNNIIVEGNVTYVLKNKLLRFTVFDVKMGRFPVKKEDGITFELTEINGKTNLHVLQGDFAVVPDGEKYYLMTLRAWNRVLPKIKYLAEINIEKNSFVIEPGGKSIVISYTFNMPKEIVFAAYTDPNFIPRWWGPKRFSTIVDKMDLRVDGIWRFINRDAHGNDYVFRGVYKEIVPSERIAYTFEAEDVPGHTMNEIVTFEENYGKTKMTITDIFESIEDRDVMINSGIEEGIMEGMDSFSEILGKM